MKPNDDNVHRYHVLLYFKEREEAITVFLNEKSAFHLLDEMLAMELDTKIQDAFYRTSTLDGKDVSLNLIAIHCVHFLYEVWNFPEPDPDFRSVRFLRQGCKEMFEAPIEDLEQIDELHLDLEVVESQEKRFVHFQDLNEEYVVVNVRGLLYFESPIEMPEEDIDQ